MRPPPPGVGGVLLNKGFRSPAFGAIKLRNLQNDEFFSVPRDRPCHFQETTHHRLLPAQIAYLRRRVNVFRIRVNAK